MTADRDIAIAVYSDTYKDIYNVRPSCSWEGVATPDIWDSIAALAPSEQDLARWDAEQRAVEVRWEEEALAEAEAEAEDYAEKEALRAADREDILWALQDSLEQQQ